MKSNESKSNESKSNVLDLESTEKEIQNTQIQYEEAYKNYIHLLNSPKVSKEYIQLKGRTYWGVKGLNQTAVTNVDNCQALCSSNPLCTGATFVANKNFCFVRGGEGDLMAGSDTSVAIVTQLQNATLQLKALNDKLLYLNQQLNMLINKSQPDYHKGIMDTNNKGIKLHNNYNELLEQQKEINALLNQYQSVNAEYKDSSLLVNQESFIYRFFYVLVVLIIFIGIIILFNLGSGGFNIVLILLITSFIFYLL